MYVMGACIMSDDIDRANDYAQILTDAALSVRKPSGPAVTGYCLNCDKQVDAPRRWCDADCRDTWERKL